ncbi:MAG: hypothetical protein QW826_06960 [Candidatus Nezhaarchaeales archaeon]
MMVELIDRRDDVGAENFEENLRSKALRSSLHLVQEVQSNDVSPNSPELTTESLVLRARSEINLNRFQSYFHSWYMSERELKEVGTVTHYYTRIGVAIVNLVDTLSVGDRILIKGATTNFEQNVESMQIERKNVNTAYSGQTIGLKVIQRVREGDKVYKIV